MSKARKLIDKILSGRSDSNISFNEIVTLLLTFGFEMRTRGGHHLFRREGIEEKINLQKDGSHAKPYQIKQIRNIILKYHLGDTGSE